MEFPTAFYDFLEYIFTTGQHRKDKPFGEDECELKCGTTHKKFHERWYGSQRKAMRNFMYWCFTEGVNRPIAVLLELAICWLVEESASPHGFKRSNFTGEEGLLGKCDDEMIAFNKCSGDVAKLLDDLGLQPTSKCIGN